MDDPRARRREIRDWIDARKGRALDLADDQPLAGVLNSLDFLELLLMLDTRYGVRVNPFDVGPEQLDTVGRIADFISRRAAD